MRVSCTANAVRGLRALAASLLVLPLCAGLSTGARAMPSLAFAHVGETDPEDVTEGWTRLGFAFPGVLDEGLADVEVGAVDPDLGCSFCGVMAWGIDDRADVAGSVLRYEHTPSQQQVLDAGALGWTLRVRLRLATTEDNQLPSADPVDASAMVEYREGGFGAGRRFRVLFGANDYGSPIVSPSGTSEEYFDPIVLNNQFVLYELIYRPDLGSATLFVDGTEQISGYLGETGVSGSEGVAWGSDSDTGLGRGHFNLVEWEIGLPVCFDGLDNDGDGLFDVDDPSCLGDPNGATEDQGTQCDDGFDNDADGLADLADPSCLDDPTLDSEDLGTLCDDHLDNDGDGSVDLDDSTCAGDPRNTAEVTACDDGVDNDADGRADLADAGCLADVTRDDEAGEIVVNTTLDKLDADPGDGVCETEIPGECSLRAAIRTSGLLAGLQGVQLPAGDYDVDLVYTGSGTGSLRIDDDMVLVGDGADLTRIGPDTPSFPDPIIRLVLSGDVSISGVTVRGGTASSGGGIAISEGSLTLGDSTITGNHATNSGGLQVGGNGHVKVIRSSITANTATWNAGGFSNGITSKLDVIDSTISNNTAGYVGGGLVSGVVTILDSTISGNTATTGLSHGVGGIRFGGGHHQVANSTFSGNAGTGGGGLMADSVGVVLTHVTATDNTPNGICTWTFGVGPYVENSIIAGNHGANCGFPNGPPISLGYNLTDDTSCPFSEIGDIVNTPALLGPLTDNGGETLTHMLLAGSPAIDAADNLICPATDQRGHSRPEDGDLDGYFDCDMGAIELPEPTGALPLALGCGLLVLLGRNRDRTRTR